VHSAQPHDSTSGYEVLTQVIDKLPSVRRVLADQGYQGDIQKWFHRKSKGAVLSVIKSSSGTKGFNLQKWRWVVERSFAWLGNFRRLSKDYEITVSSSRAFVQLAFIRIMLKRARKCFT
jgi:putative transposase